MSELLPIFVSSLFFAALAEWNSTYITGQYGEKIYIKKDRFFIIIMSVIMILFVGLRVAYNDTTAYTHTYELMQTDASVFKTIDWSLGSNPGFHFVNAILRVSGVSTQNFLMFYAVITLGIYIWFLRKYTVNLWLSIFLFFTIEYYTFSMAAIKQCVAVAFCLLAVDNALQKKWGLFAMWIAVACTFHPYSIMYAVTPFLMFPPWTRKTFFLLVIFACGGIALQTMLGVLVDITSMIGETYDIAEFSGEGVNIFRLAVVWAPVILSFIARKFWQTNHNKEQQIIMNFTMLNAEIMFIALFGTANYFARLANYFLIFQALALPLLLNYFTKDSKKIVKVGIVSGYLLYYYYAAGIAQGGFDYMHRGISLIDYINSFF